MRDLLSQVEMFMYSLFVIVVFDGIFIGPYTPRNKVWSYEGPEIIDYLIVDV